MTDTDILILGAGAAGLMAARTLAKAGKKVIVIEARDRIGGRIHTVKHGPSQQTMELGAEFIHGDLPVTQCLLEEAGIAYPHASANMYKYENGEFTTDGPLVEHWDELIEKLNALEQDITIDQFLQREFNADKYEGTRKMVRQYVSGYDNGDPAKASSFSLRKEWQAEDMGAQYRIAGGYVSLVDYLADEIKQAGGQICLNENAKQIEWQQGRVMITTKEGNAYKAKQVLIALPLGVLQAGIDQSASLSFKPTIPVYSDAIAAMGFGAVIKVLLEFDEAFWESKETEDMGYLFSEQEIPTWWTQSPQQSNVLTGWLGGPPAEAKTDMANDELLTQSVQSLANIFKYNATELRKKLLSWKIVNWTADEFTLGSYAYDTIAASEARKIICQPLQDTIFFAGEYLYEGTAMGTVEAALTTGLRMAEQILRFE
ncbi:flavin monoamine oxidase family protein [Mucilaginibacter flavus]|uniref:flavin monoamine oxidase family protein n=1 Tax=Mucilaginibacter flavus TaxID=931504 RepID=UPI0025B4D87F|nr:NAD(P)/FAD-dependent oxidoreductase [Mucilaginibacter flavus]MDN3581299.1 NAD(P)/FAD-dependent oxidoreductase [Mucilaginibacter flavus]